MEDPKKLSVVWEIWHGGDVEEYGGAEDAYSAFEAAVEVLEGITQMDRKQFVHQEEEERWHYKAWYFLIGGDEYIVQVRPWPTTTKQSP